MTEVRVALVHEPDLTYCQLATALRGDFVESRMGKIHRTQLGSCECQTRVWHLMPWPFFFAVFAVMSPAG